MAWSDAARAAALEARRMHPVQRKSYAKALKEARGQIKAGKVIYGYLHKTLDAGTRNELVRIRAKKRI